MSRVNPLFAVMAAALLGGLRTESDPVPMFARTDPEPEPRPRPQPLPIGPLSAPKPYKRPELNRSHEAARRRRQAEKRSARSPSGDES